MTLLNNTSQPTKETKDYRKVIDYDARNRLEIARVFLQARLLPYLEQHKSLSHVELTRLLDAFKHSHDLIGSDFDYNQLWSIVWIERATIDPSVDNARQRINCLSMLLRQIEELELDPVENAPRSALLFPVLA